MATPAATLAHVCLGLCMLPAPGSAQSLPAPADIAAKCPEALREGAELRKRMPARKTPAAPTRPALRQNLLLMARQDQQARMPLLSNGGHIDPATPEGAHLARVDARNLERLRHIVAQDGFPTAAMVGLDGVDAMLLLTTHGAADPDFQEQVLELAAPYARRGDVRADQLATLTDDVLFARGKKQRYGTNFALHDGELRRAPIEDEDKVDQRRREVGLISLANDACLTRALHGAATSR